MTNILSSFIPAILLLVNVLQAVQAQPLAQDVGVRILGCGIHYDGNIVYNYKVVNSGTKTVIGFVIGSEFDSEENYSYPQLVRLPLGWSYGITGETGREILLAPGSTNQPTRWQSKVYGQQESGLYYLEWNSYTGTGSRAFAVQPGQTMAGFSVPVPLMDNKLSLPMVTGQPVYTGPDENYLKGNFMATIDTDIHDVNAKIDRVWGSIEREDTTPPTLTVSLSPNTLSPANDNLVPITATITVKDDYDPQPEVELVSIMANDTLGANDGKDIQPGTDDRQFQLLAKRAGTNQAGRIYIVTYSATDGSGNKTTASATVTVSHVR